MAAGAASNLEGTWEQCLERLCSGEIDVMAYFRYGGE